MCPWESRTARKHHTKTARTRACVHLHKSFLVFTFLWTDSITDPPYTRRHRLPLTSTDTTGTWLRPRVLFWSGLLNQSIIRTWELPFHPPPNCVVENDKRRLVGRTGWDRTGTRETVSGRQDEDEDESGEKTERD